MFLCCDRFVVNGGLSTHSKVTDKERLLHEVREEFTENTEIKYRALVETGHAPSLRILTFAPYSSLIYSKLFLFSSRTDSKKYVSVNNLIIVRRRAMYKYLFSLLLFLSASVLVYSQGMDEMSKEAKYKMIYNEVLGALTTGKTDVLDKYVASDFVEHDPSPMMSDKTGIERIKEDFAAYHKLFPDMKAQVHSIAVSGDMLFAYLTFTGTAAEDHMGMPAGHKMTMNAVDIVRFKGDKAVEHWGFTSNADIMKMMQEDKMMHEEMDKK